MRQPKLLVLIGVLSVGGALLITSPSWAADSEFDHFRPDKYEHGFDHVVACPDGYYSVTGKKGSDDDDGDLSVRHGDYKSHDDCWIARN